MTGTVLTAGQGALGMDKDEAARSERGRKASLARKNPAKKGTHPCTSEMDYTAEELEFMAAIREYQARTNRKFPSWSEVLRVLKGIGYDKIPGDRDMAVICLPPKDGGDLD